MFPKSPGPEDEEFPDGEEVVGVADEDDVLTDTPLLAR